mmetsp:Transcript_24522/g.68747  ORF Transcript_24522/g.68747 Transcript_24522/m.68747 type:complete len:145 (-) Transcript_24522:608-1042(-)
MSESRRLQCIEGNAKVGDPLIRAARRNRGIHLKDLLVAEKDIERVRTFTDFLGIFKDNWRRDAMFMEVHDVIVEEDKEKADMVVIPDNDDSCSNTDIDDENDGNSSGSYDCGGDSLGTRKRKRRCALVQYDNSGYNIGFVRQNC